METKGPHGAPLAEGNAVTGTKYLKVKDSSLALKRGTLAQNIRLTSLASEIEGRAGGSALVLKIKFLKKV